MERSLEVAPVASAAVTGEHMVHGAALAAHLAQQCALLQRGCVRRAAILIS